MLIDQLQTVSQQAFYGAAVKASLLIHCQLYRLRDFPAALYLDIIPELRREVDDIEHKNAIIYHAVPSDGPYSVHGMELENSCAGYFDVEAYEEVLDRAALYRYEIGETFMNEEILEHFST